MRSVEDAAFPINGNEAYYRLFGRRGFREYQVLFPIGARGAASREVQRLVAAAGVPVTLGSLKLFRGDRRLLWFRGEGVCFAVDVPAGEATDRLFAQLDRLVLDHGGLVNLSKDSRVAGATVRALYQGYDEFCRRLGGTRPEAAVRFDAAAPDRCLIVGGRS